MTLLVPFDGSDLSEAALVRAVQFGEVLEEDVLALSVIPKGNAQYARERDWLGPEESYDLNAIVTRLHEQVATLRPSANFRHTTVGRYAPPGSIASRVRQVARTEDAVMVVIGSENAGRIVSSVASVGATVATDRAYDVVIVRDPEPATIAKFGEGPADRRPRSG